jgi:hypothetical protein
MNIKHALDWQDIRSRLRTEMSAAGYNPDLNKMLKNIDSMVTELSKLEVHARRIGQATSLTKNKVEDINKAIKHLDQLTLMAKLMR